MPKPIAACIVLYRPSTDVVFNIQSYYPYVDFLIAIDNSEYKNPTIENTLQQHFPKLVYRFQNKNLGIAAALTIAADIAISNGCNWLLTMDQDSSFIGNDLSKMISDIDVIEQMYGRVGIISPIHILAEEFIKKQVEDFTVRNVTMTSGNLLNLAAYSAIGKYDESLFMDFVDYEYCLRLRKNNYKIVQDNKVNLKHSLGNFHIRHFFGKPIGISNHNYQRRYYMTRNSLLVGTKYYDVDRKFFFGVILNNLILDPFIILFYEDNKWAKIKSVARGVVHFLMKKRGTIRFS